MEVKGAEPVQNMWFALHVRSQCERIVADALRAAGIADFYPSYWEETRWSDRIKSVERPLFPGYLFADFAPEPAGIHRILATRGVVRVLGDSSGPIAIDGADVEAIRAMLESGLPIKVETTAQQYNPGARVTVIRGSLHGQEGVVMKQKRRSRVVVSIPMLNRTVSVEMDNDGVRELLTAA
jgi:transcriptional antiterminator NusG